MEDPSKQGRKITEIDQDPGISLIQHDVEIQGRHEHELEFDFDAANVPVTTAGMITSVVTNSVFRGFFEKQKLTGPNFIDWYRQLRIVLSVEDKLDYLEQPIPPAPVPAQAGQQVAPEALAAHAAWVKGSKEIARIMLMTMEPEIQLDLENLSAYEMLQELKTLFAQKHTVQNFSMHGMGKTVNELHAMLKLHEQTQPNQNALALHVIRAGKVQKKKNKQKLRFRARGQYQGKGKNKHAYDPKPKISPPRKRKFLLRTQSVINVELAVQGLRGSRKLKPGALSLYVGNGQRAAVEAIGSYHLSLPSGLAIVLNNCHYAPSITRGIISVSRLYDDGHVNRLVDNSIQVSRNNMVYFSVVPRDGIFEIDLSDSYINVSSMYALSNKRAKSNLDSALLWHCRLGHISNKHIEKLQHDGLLNLNDLRAFEKCVPCMSGKMARKPYTHQVERAKDLLGLIHTDVCGPFKIVSRQGASYFITFTDDFSRYCYVYLLKHKHEVFETFKVFQKEVENQLGKTIKLLRSDRGGEYMSQEFLEHLKDHGYRPSYSSLHTTTQWCIGEEKQNPTRYGSIHDESNNSSKVLLGLCP
ncbi:retrotransposon protein, putative, ty1-copia subclass [Tanacetum coccineum]